jgi:competence protein ComEA
MEPAELAEPVAADVPRRPDPPRSMVTRVRQWIQWFGPGRLAVTAASVLAVVAGGWLLVRVPSPPVEQSLPRATTGAADVAGSGVASTAATPPTAGVIVVHVAGAVSVPGVYRLAQGARVDDAVTSAGGAQPDADVDVINRAAPATDGMRVYVPRRGEAPPAGPAAPAGTAAVAGPLDLNTAAQEALEELPGIGPATAAAIVAHRDRNGPFGAVDDLAEVRGIGPAKLDALRDLVTV